MKKSLVLGILEGRDWNPIEGYKTVIEAHLDNHKLSTSVYPLTNSPKFNTEVTWEAEKQIIRSYKLNRVPIKIVCYALDEKNKRKLLGYIVLPLTSAVEGVEGDSKWYKLLGGPKGSYKTPPSILLRLHMEAKAMTLDQRNQINGKEVSVKNGSRGVENVQLSSILEKKHKVLQQVNLKAGAAQTNGNGDAEQFIQYPLQNSFHLQTSNGNLQNVEGTNQIDSDNMEEEGEVEEGDLDSDEEYLDDEEDDGALGTIVGAYSLNRFERNENTSSSDTAMESPVSFNNGEEPVQVHSNSVDANSFNTGVHTVHVTEGSSQRAEGAPRKDLEVEQLLKTRTSVKDHLKRFTESLRSSEREKQTFESSSLIRRLSDTSSMLDLSCEHKNKSRKLDNSVGISCSDSLQKIEKLSEENRSNDIKYRLSQNKEATAVGILLSQSIADNSESNQKDFSSEVLDYKEKKISSNCKYSPNAKLIPKLNPEEGYFHIGSEHGEEVFHFSVTIIYAKNLSKVIPENTSPSVKEGYRFCYSLLGHPIYTDSFSNLDDPEFVAEKALAKIRSSHKSLSRYFGQHPFLPIYFMIGEEALGVCNVDIGFLMDVATKNKVHFQDVYQVNPMDEKIVLNENENRNKPVIAVAFEVSKSCDIINFNFSNISTKHSGTNNEVSVSDSASSNSELDEDYKHKVKSKKNKRRYSLKNYLNEEKALNAEKSFEREKKSMLFEAAYEIEQWKEEKRRIFLKDWSAKEETFQRLLASEWSSKVKLIEEELSHRISQCDQLQEKLNKGLTELSLKEEKYKLKENQVKRLEDELHSEKLHLLKLKENCQGSEGATNKGIFTKQLHLEKSKNEQLENEIRRLKEELRNTNENLNLQSQEIFNLRRKLVLSDDLIGVSKEKEILQNKVDHLQERKQYYKSQWLSALTDLHKLHSAHKKTVDEITCGTKTFSSEEVYPTMSSSSSSSIGIKLKKLKDERRILLESGLYSSNHSIIKNIDKKIKDLIG